MHQIPVDQKENTKMSDDHGNKEWDYVCKGSRNDGEVH